MILHVIAEGRDVIGIVLRIEGWLVVEDRISAAQTGLSVFERVPRESNAGREIVVVGIGDGLPEGVAETAR